MNRSDTSTLDEIRELAKKLEGVRTARQRYEISKKINSLSKQAQADALDARALGVWRDPERWQTANMRASYDRGADIFYVFALPMQESDCIYVDFDDFLTIVSRDMHEIVGCQVNDFCSVWLKSHPEVQAQADKVKVPIAHPLLRRFSGTWGDFTTAVERRLTHTLGEIPTHARVVV